MAGMGAGYGGGMSAGGAGGMGAGGGVGGPPTTGQLAWEEEQRLLEERQRLRMEEERKKRRQQMGMDPVDQYMSGMGGVGGGAPSGAMR